MASEAEKRSVWNEMKKATSSNNKQLKPTLGWPSVEARDYRLSSSEEKKYQRREVRIENKKRENWNEELGKKLCDSPAKMRSLILIFDLNIY